MLAYEVNLWQDPGTWRSFFFKYFLIHKFNTTLFFGQSLLDKNYTTYGLEAIH